MLMSIRGEMVKDGMVDVDDAAREFFGADSAGEEGYKNCGSCPDQTKCSALFTFPQDIIRKKIEAREERASLLEKARTHNDPEKFLAEVRLKSRQVEIDRLEEIILESSQVISSLQAELARSEERCQNAASRQDQELQRLERDLGKMDFQYNSLSRAFEILEKESGCNLERADFFKGTLKIIEAEVIGIDNNTRKHVLQGVFRKLQAIIADALEKTDDEDGAASVVERYSIIRVTPQ